MEANKNLLRKLYGKRSPWSHKGNFGKLLIIGGSRRYSGSPALAAIAAMKSGADLVTVAGPKRSADIVASFSPDLITEPLNGDYLNPWHLKAALSLSESADAVVIGGGMEKNTQTLKFVAEFLKRVKKPCVVDADGIYAVARYPAIARNSFVLTPHSHEFSILAGERPKPDMKRRTVLVKGFAKKLNSVILLKGYRDVISDGGNLCINRTGSPFMTKGGTGDTLAGICGALLARKADPFLAACASAYINGKAGDLAARKYGESLTAMDLLEEIHRILK